MLIGSGGNNKSLPPFGLWPSRTGLAVVPDPFLDTINIYWTQKLDGADGELLLTSRQDGVIRMLVPDSAR
jgi:hypothetical protein